MELVRFGVSMEKELLEKFDQLLKKEGFPNRSLAIRSLVRDFLAEKYWEKQEGETTGVITLVYNHEVRGFTDLFLSLQHQFLPLIISTTHVHCDFHHCLEVILVKGETTAIFNFYRQLQSLKGVKTCKISLVSEENS